MEMAHKRSKVAPKVTPIHTIALLPVREPLAGGNMRGIYKGKDDSEEYISRIIFAVQTSVIFWSIDLVIYNVLL